MILNNCKTNKNSKAFNMTRKILSVENILKNEKRLKLKKHTIKHLRNNGKIQISLKSKQKLV